jgi:hypothetical protein
MILLNTSADIRNSKSFYEPAEDQIENENSATSQKK